MTFRRTAPRLLAAAAALALTLAGCGSDGGSTTAQTDAEAGEPRRGGTATMAINVESPSLDPALCGAQPFDRCVPLFGTLLREAEEGDRPEPYMAESFESEDGRNWTLKLRPGMTFSDGTPFDAAAVVANWDRIKDPATLSPAIATAKAMTWKVVDPTTVSVTVDKPNFQLPWALVLDMGMIGSPTAMKAKGADFGNAPVGAGPFVLEKWTRNSQVSYLRNPTYWEEGLPYLDKYVVKLIGADDQRLNALRSGEIDIDWSLLRKDAKKAESEGFDVHSAPLVGGTGVQFNYKDPVVGDPDARQALLLAFDPAQINAAVYPGDEPTTALLYPDSPYRDDSKGTYPEPDLAKAQEHWKAYLAKTGKTKETVTFKTYAGVPVLEQVATILQAQMQKLPGLTLSIQALDGPTFVGDTRSGKFQLALGSTLSRNMDRLYDRFHSTGALNISGYVNPKVDAALDAARATDDEDDVTEAYQVVNGELSKDAPLRTYRYPEGFLITDEAVKGLRLAGSYSGVSTYPERIWLDE